MLGIHLALIFVVPDYKQQPFTQSVPLMLIYLTKFVSFVLGALQIKYGFPLYTQGTPPPPLFSRLCAGGGLRKWAGVWLMRIEGNVGCCAGPFRNHPHTHSLSRLRTRACVVALVSFSQASC